LASNYLKALQLTKQLEKKAQEATHNRKMAEEEIAAAEEIIKAAKKMDANVAKAEAKLTEATSAFSKKEFKSALEHATESKNIAQKAQEDHVKMVLDSTRNLVKLAKDMGVKAPDLDKTLSQSEEAIKGDNFEEALKFAEKGWEAVDKLLNEKVSEAFTRAQSMIVMAKQVEQDVSEVEGLLNKAREHAEKNNYEKALKFINECVRLTGKLAKEEISKQIENAMIMIELAKKMGADIKSTENSYEKSKTALNAEDYETSLEFIGKSLSEAEKLVEKGSTNLVREDENLVKQAKDINAEVTKATLLLNRAKDALKDKKFEEVYDFSNQIKEEVENAQFQCVLKAISLSRPKFITAKNIGADLSEPMKFLDMARKSLKEKKFLEALDLARKGENSVNRLIGDYEGAKEELQLITQALSRASRIGVDTKHLSDEMKEAKNAFDEKNYKKAMNLIAQCRKNVEKSMQDRTMEIVQKSEKIISIGEKTGSNIKKAREYLAQAESSAKENDFEKAISLAKKSREDAGEAISAGVSSEINFLKGICEALEDTDERSKCMLILSNSKDMLGKGEYEDAYQNIVECENIVEGYAKAAIEVAEVNIGTLREMKGETSEFEKRLTQTKDFLGEKKYSEVISLSKKIVQYLNEQQEKIVSELSKAIIDDIQKAKKIGMDISELSTKLVAAREAIERKFYKKAYIIMTQSKEETTSFLTGYKEFSEVIIQLKSQLDEAKKNGVDISVPIKKLEVAEKALVAGDFKTVSGLVDEIKTEIHKDTIVHSINDRISHSREWIDIAKNLEVDTSDAELQLKKTIIYLNNGQLENALDSANKTAEISEELINTKISDMLSSAYSMIIEAKKIGLDVLTVEVLYQKAEEALELHRYDKAARYANQSLQEIEEIRDESQRTANIIHLAGNYIQEAENIKADVSEAKRLLERAFSELKNNEYLASIELGKKCIRLAKKAKEDKVLESIELFQSIIDKSKKEGMNVSKAESLLEEARIALEDEDYKEALRLAMISESEVEKVDLQKKMAAEIIAVTAAKLKEAEKKGIAAESVRSLLINAATALKNNEYINALEYAMESGLELSEKSEEYERASTTLHAALARVNESADIGVDVSRAKELLDTANKAFADRKYSTAIKFAKETIREAKRSYVDNLSKPINSCEQLINTAMGLDVDVMRAKNMLNEARAALEEESYSQVAFFTENCKRLVEREISRNLFEKLSSARAKLEKAKSKGIDLTDVMALLESGESSLESKEYLNAAKYLQKFMDNLGALETGVVKGEGETVLEKEVTKEIEVIEKGGEPETDLDALISDLDKKIKLVSKSGMSTKNAEKLLNEAKEIMKNEPEKAIKLGREAEEALEKELAPLSPKVSVELNIDEVKEKDKWYETTFTILNDGKSVAKDMSFKMKGKDFDVEGFEPLKILKAKEKKEIPVKVKAIDTGELIFDLEIIFYRIFDGKKIDIQLIREIQIEEAEKEPQFKKYKAQKAIKCYACNGKIKPGLVLIKCNCGNTYHEACGERLGRCPMCGVVFKKKTSAKKKLALRVG